MEKTGMSSTQPPKSELTPEEERPENQNTPELATEAPVVRGVSNFKSWAAYRYGALVVLLSGALGFSFWWQAQALKLGLNEQRLLAMRDQQTLERALRNVENQQNQANQLLTKELDDLRLGLIALRKETGREKQGWILAEVEYLLLIANHRIKLLGDVPTALQALQEADDRLRHLGNPEFLATRKHLAAEIVQLKAIKIPDINGMVLKLDSLAQDARLWPLNGPAPGRLRAPTPDVKTDVEKSADSKAILSGAWQEMRKLVVIRRRDKPILPMLNPEQERAIRQVLEMRLLTARIALLNVDGARFSSALQQAYCWIGENFLLDEKAVASAMGSIRELNKEIIAPPLPDISGSLNEVRYHLNKSKIDPKPVGGDNAATSTPKLDSQVVP